MPITLACQYCGTTFTRNPAQVKRTYFCSVACGNAYRKKSVTLVCEQCNISFQRSPSEAKRTRFCSAACRSVFQKKVTLICKQCGTSFQCISSRSAITFFCSHKCHHLSITIRITLICEQCGTSFKRIPSETKKARFCSILCLNTFQKRLTIICKQCGKPFPYSPSEEARNKNFCSRTCYNIARTQPGTPAEKARIHQKRRRARKAYAPINDLTLAQWVEIQAAYDHRCVYCGRRRKGHLTQDHITPLSKHGPNTASNVVPACLRCNKKKFTGPPLIPIQPLLFTIAKARPIKMRKPAA